MVWVQSPAMWVQPKKYIYTVFWDLSGVFFFACPPSLNPPHSTHLIFLFPLVLLSWENHERWYFKMVNFQFQRDRTHYNFNYYCFRDPCEPFAPHHSKMNEESMDNGLLVDRAALNVQTQQRPGDRWQRSRQPLPYTFFYPHLHLSAQVCY